VTCTTAFTNNFVAATTPTTPTTTPPGNIGVATPTPVAPGTGSGVTGRTGSAAGAGGSTNTLGSLGFVPSGAPQTGFGGAAHSNHRVLVLLGSMVLIAAGLTLALAMRRRRFHTEPSADDVA
jgi:hypothetical protein